MNTPFESLYYIFFAIGIFFAFIQLCVLIYQSHRGNRIRKAQETIAIYNRIYIDTYKVKRKLEDVDLDIFNVSIEELKAKNLFGSVMNLLTLIDGFGAGVNENIYDKKVFKKLTSPEIVNIFVSLLIAVHNYNTKNDKNPIFPNINKTLLFLKKSNDYASVQKLSTFKQFT